MRAWFGTLVLASFVFSAGCSSGPKYKIDEALLADVPVAEKENILRAKSEIDMATEERNKAQNDLAVADKDVSVSDSELGQYKLEVTKVKAERDLAAASKDVNRINAVKSQLMVAELARDVADAKLDWQKQRRRAAKALLNVAEKHVVAGTARYEQAKAQLAAAKGKSPDPKFTVANYDSQASEAQAKYDQAKVDADRAQQDASRQEQRYNSLLQRLQQLQQTQGAQQPQPSGQPLQGGQPPQGGQPQF